MTLIFSLWQLDLAQKYENLDLFTNETHPQFQLFKVNKRIIYHLLNVIVVVKFLGLFLLYLRKKS